MRLYFRDTKLSYSQISNLLTTHIGPAGPDTWQNGADTRYNEEKQGAFCAYVEIYNDHPATAFVVLKW